jgi:hypothetical protein
MLAWAILISHNNLTAVAYVISVKVDAIKTTSTCVLLTVNLVTFIRITISFFIFEKLDYLFLHTYIRTYIS